MRGARRSRTAPRKSGHRELNRGSLTVGERWRMARHSGRGGLGELRGGRGAAAPSAFRWSAAAAADDGYAALQRDASVEEGRGNRGGGARGAVPVDTGQVLSVAELPTPPLRSDARAQTARRATTPAARPRRQRQRQHHVAARSPLPGRSSPYEKCSGLPVEALAQGRAAAHGGTCCRGARAAVLRVGLGRSRAAAAAAGAARRRARDPEPGGAARAPPRRPRLRAALLQEGEIKRRELYAEHPEEQTLWYDAIRAHLGDAPAMAFSRDDALIAPK